MNLIPMMSVCMRIWINIASWDEYVCSNPIENSPLTSLDVDDPLNVVALWCTLMPAGVVFCGGVLLMFVYLVMLTFFLFS